MVASASLGCAQELLQPVAGAGTRGGTGSMAQAPMVACKSTRSAAQAPTAACRGTGSAACAPTVACRGTRSDPGLRGTPVLPTLQLLLLIVNVRRAAAGGRFVVSAGSQYGVRRGAGRKGGTLVSLPPACCALQLCLFRAHLPTAQAAFRHPIASCRGERPVPRRVCVPPQLQREDFATGGHCHRRCRSVHEQFAVALRVSKGTWSLPPPSSPPARPGRSLSPGPSLALVRRTRPCPASFCARAERHQEKGRALRLQGGTLALALAPARQHEGTGLEGQGREMCEILCWLEGFFEGRKGVQACPGSQKSRAGRELVSPC